MQHVEIPKTWPLKYKIVSKPLAFWLNHREEPLNLGFSLKISEDEFGGDATPDLKKIFDKYALKILKQLNNKLYRKR